MSLASNDMLFRAEHYAHTIQLDPNTFRALVTVALFADIRLEDVWLGLNHRPDGWILPRCQPHCDGRVLVVYQNGASTCVGEAYWHRTECVCVRPNRTGVIEDIGIERVLLWRPMPECPVLPDLPGEDD